jgi:hypothetical protein
MMYRKIYILHKLGMFGHLCLLVCSQKTCVYICLYFCVCVSVCMCMCVLVLVLLFACMCVRRGATLSRRHCLALPFHSSICVTMTKWSG